MGEKISDWVTCAKLVQTIASNFKVPYFTISPTYSICKNHGYLSGEESICPICNEETEVYSRITGYYRPIKHWNDGKQSEYLMRKEYKNYSNCNIKNESFSDLADKILFTTETCPKCPEAKSILKNEENLRFINASESMDEAIKYGVRSVPSLVVVHKNNQFKIYAGINEIYNFLSL